MADTHQKRSRTKSSASTGLPQQQQQQPPASSSSSGGSTGGDLLITSIASPETKSSMTTFADFKLYDNHPRKQRHYLQAMKQQEQKLIEEHVIINSEKKLQKKDLPKMKTKDIDLPFKRATQSKLMSKMFGSNKGNKMKKSPDVALNMIRLAIMDNKEDLAEQYLLQLPQSLLKKKRPYEANHIFLLAMSRQMEKLALIILDRGFPLDVNAPIFTMKATSKNSRNIPFKINTSLFPSYFILAVSMGFETIVRFMIKLGANVNQMWYGLTPLHIALYCDNGQANLVILNTLLEYGADPWLGIHWEQLELMMKLKEASCNLELQSKQPIPALKEMPAELNSLPLLGVLQRQLPQYSFDNNKSFVDQSSSLAQDKKSLLNNNNNNVLKKDLSNNEIYLNEWKRDKFILPLAFAASMGNRTAALAILQKMSLKQSSKGKQSQLQSTPVRSVSNASSTSATINDRMFQRDLFSLLVQQDAELTIYLLKSQQVDICQRDPKGSTALHLAIRTGNFELVQILLHFDTPEGLLLNAQGENGWTALHEAISIPNLEIFRFLFKKSPRLDVKNDYGDTPKDLGLKLGIDLTDLEQVWFAPVKTIPSSDNTIMPGAGSTEILTQLDSRLVRLLNSPMFESSGDKKNKNILDLSASPLLKRSTTGEKAINNSMLKESNSLPSTLLPSTSTTANTTTTATTTTTTGNKNKTTFSKMFGKKRHTIDATINANDVLEDSSS